MAETTSRTLALLNLLQTHRHWPGPELAGRLEVTERTLRRDIDRLRELGYAIEATRGSAGGYRLGQGAQLPPLLLTDEEAVTMAIGLRLAAAQGIVDGEQSSLSALAKLEQVLPAALRSRVNALGAHLEPDERSGDLVSLESLGQLSLACRDRERIRFDYTSGDGTESKRIVEPHSVAASARNWFLIAWDLDRAAWRTFRVDRITRVFGTRVHFPERELPAERAGEFLQAAQASLIADRVRAEVVLAMPFAEMKAYFGPWGEGAYALDEEHTVWPQWAPDLNILLYSLVWIPEGVDFTIRGSDEFAALAASWGRRLSRLDATP